MATATQGIGVTETPVILTSFGQFPPPQFVECEIVYPDSDGEPVADNTKQLDLMITIKSNLDHWLPRDFVAANLFWYPVKGRPDIRTAPDGMVALGRPKGYRSSYKQWDEDGIAPQVVFEIWSPANPLNHQRDKLVWYERYGVNEFYAFDPFTGELEGWQRVQNRLTPIADVYGWISPALDIRFEVEFGELVIYDGDGKRFETMEVMLAEAEAAREDAEAERQAKERAFAKLRELGIDPTSL